MRWYTMAVVQTVSMGELIYKDIVGRQRKGDKRFGWSQIFYQGYHFLTEGTQQRLEEREYIKLLEQGIERLNLRIQRLNLKYEELTKGDQNVVLEQEQEGNRRKI